MHKIIKFIAVLIAFLLVTVFGCPILKISGVQCPACGVTRAWINFLSGNFKAAFSYNLLFLPLTAIFLRIAFCYITNKNIKPKEQMIYCSIAFLAFANNVVRILM